MDSLRGHFSGHSDPASDYEYESTDEEAVREPPPGPVGQDERRMQVRAYNFWASLLNNRNFPSIEELDPTTLTDFGPYSVLLDFTVGIDNPAIRYLGDRLADECGAQGPISSLDDVPGRSLLSRITDHYMQILANQAPIGFEAEFVNQAGRTILYRGILLPFSSDDDAIDFIYGVINWKELADQKTTDELLLEIDQALEPRSELPRSDGPMTEWADGPAETGGILELGHDDAIAFGGDDDLAIPAPTFGDEVDFMAPADAEAMSLADWLASARELANIARSAEDRSHHALYAAVGRAWDFALAAADHPADLAEILEDAGLVAQERAPMTPIVKLVFGADYDKTRLAEYASVLGHAQRTGITAGDLARYLGDAPGGLKGVVASERKLRRAETGKPAAARTTPRAALARKLRRLAATPIAQVAAQGSEFTLLVARRTPDGEVVLLGEVADDVNLFEKAARKLVS
jgi:hypothetical protein